LRGDWKSQASACSEEDRVQTDRLPGHVAMKSWRSVKKKMGIHRGVAFVMEESAGGHARTINGGVESNWG